MLKNILQDLQLPISYLGYAALLSLALTVLLTSLRCYRSSRCIVRSSATTFLFLTYAIVLLKVVLFSREPGSRTTVDLIPFSTIGTTTQSKAYAIENILMFFPMGIFLPMLSRRFQSLKTVALTLPLLSIGIELTQFFAKRGYLQTDDVIMNVLGGILGFFTIRMIQAIQKLSRSLTCNNKSQ